MSLRRDGTAKMVNLFKPADARWKLNEQGIVLYDPQHPERFSQALPVRKRDQDRIWILLPFTGGATGIGLVRVPDDEPSKVEPRPRSGQRKYREIEEERKDPFDW